MNMLVLLSFMIILLVIVAELAGWLALKSNRDIPEPEPAQWPMAAVLIAARNEAATLKDCLSALEKADYPSERLSVWIGNDSSDDATLEIASNFCQGKKNFHVLNITRQSGQAGGKANVLAQLANEARKVADYYFITDADVRVNPYWLKGMLRYFVPGVGIVNGATLTKGKSWFSRMQALDWIKGQAMLKAYTILSVEGQPLTAIGNNMVVQRKAYEATGGYESIPFSLTEDYELHRQLSRRGYKSRLVTDSAVRAYTLPVKSAGALLQQRKRWMSGALQLPWPVISVLFLQVLFLPAILISLYYYPLAGFFLLMAKILAQALFIREMLLRLKEPPVISFLGFEVYSFLLGIGQTIFYILPVKVKWKGRKY